MRILYVEDEERLASAVIYLLKKERIAVDWTADGEEGLEMALRGGYDCLVLDIMLPGISGVEILSSVRGRGLATPIIMLSALSEVEDKVKALETGADDYLAKPFGVLELVARVKANIRRSKSAKADKNVISYDEVTVNVDEHTASVRGKNLALTLKEFNLLKLLVENVGKVVTRETILADVWGYEYFGETRTLDMHIKSLRGKIAELSDVQYIHTVRGVGYKFNKE